VVGATAVVTLADGSVSDARVAITALAPTIRRVVEAEAALDGSDGGDEAVLAAAKATAHRSAPIPDVRGPGGSPAGVRGGGAHGVNPAGGKIGPPTAKLAGAKARQLADNLISVIKGAQAAPFDYTPRGSMAAGTAGQHQRTAVDRPGSPRP